MKRKRWMGVAVFAAVASVLLSGCGDDGNGGGDDTSSDTPVAGGTATIMQISEQRSLDPAVLGQGWSLNSAVGNGLFGTLMENDASTGELLMTMAESFVTEDGGKTFTLTLRDGLVFSDGTAFTAEAVKVNWDRLKDPANGTSALVYAVMIESTEVIDDQNLRVTMVDAVPNFGQAIAISSLNWIAKPEALQAGAAAFDENPIGAGPFTLVNWARQDSLEMARNDQYWDAPKPYLDRLVLRVHNDTNQRWNAVQSGGVAGSSETNWATMSKAEKAGYDVSVVDASGGNYLTFNTKRAPFDDVRARQAVSMATDLDLINDVVYQGLGRVPDTLMAKGSAFFADVPLKEFAPEKAQALFDELAAEGKPVKFTIKTYPTAESKAVSESVQTQLAPFKNVSVEIQVFDFVEGPAIMASRDFEMLVAGTAFVDPDPTLYNAFHSGSTSNYSGIDDAELDAALLDGRLGTTAAERTEAYERVSKRLSELAPVLFYTRSAPGFVSSSQLRGVRTYGMGSVAVADLWLEK